MAFRCQESLCQEYFHVGNPTSKNTLSVSLQNQRVRLPTRLSVKWHHVDMPRNDKAIGYLRSSPRYHIGLLHASNFFRQKPYRKTTFFKIVCEILSRHYIARRTDCIEADELARNLPEFAILHIEDTHAMSPSFVKVIRQISSQDTPLP